MSQQAYFSNQGALEGRRSGAGVAGDKVKVRKDSMHDVLASSVSIRSRRAWARVCAKGHRSGAPDIASTDPSPVAHARNQLFSGEACV